MVRITNPLVILLCAHVTIDRIVYAYQINVIKWSNGKHIGEHLILEEKDEGTRLYVKKRIRKRKNKDNEESIEDTDAAKQPPLHSEIVENKKFVPSPMALNDFESMDEAVSKVDLESIESKVVRTKKYSFDLDIELPVESENREGSDSLIKIATKYEPNMFGAFPKDGAIRLPDFKEIGEKVAVKKAQSEAEPVRKKIDRSDVKSFTRLLELDPEADSDSSLFEAEDYDYLAAALGEGKPFLGLPNSFLQSGHLVLSVLCALCGFITYPGFPLTELPYEIRLFLQKGILVVYVINVIMVPFAVSKAKTVDQPAGLWAIKTLLLGGLSYNELSQIPPPKKKKNKKRRG